MSTLSEKIRKARESRIEVAGATLTIRRPTDEEALKLGAATLVDVARQFVCGWKGVSSLWLGVPGGDAAEVPFDADAWEAFVADHPEVWEPIATAVLEAYKKHREAMEAEAKN